MAEQTDSTFFERADAHIALSNEQLKLASQDRISASTNFGAARFSAWVCANLSGTVENMQTNRERAIESLTDEFRRMFIENYDDYINNWNRYNVSSPTVITRDKI